METVKKDYSFGIIPIKYLEGRSSRNVKVCLVRHAKGGIGVSLRGIVRKTRGLSSLLKENLWKRLG